MAKPEARDEILRHLRRGHFRTDACKMAGVGYTTFKTWLEDRAFRAKVLVAEGKSVDALRARIEKASANDWRAAQFLLERRNPKYAKRERVDAKVRLEPMTPEQAKARWLELTGQAWDDGG